MLFYDRPDGKRVKQPHALNVMMPYMMKGRNASSVFYEKEINVDNALAYIAEKEAGSADGLHYSLFATVMAATVRSFALRPALNRFVHRKALYQRNYLAFSFIVKQQISEEAPEVSTKVFFAPEDTLSTVTKKVNEAIAYARQHGGSPGEDLASVANRIPGGKALVMAIYRLLDRINLLPRRLVDMDPLFASCFFANLGSIGLDAPYHHLYEWGNVSIFIVLGKLEQKENRIGATSKKQHVLRIRLTVDERISEGLYLARAAALFSRLIVHPELLEMPLEEARTRLIG